MTRLPITRFRWFPFARQGSARIARQRLQQDLRRPARRRPAQVRPVVPPLVATSASADERHHGLLQTLLTQDIHC